MDNKRKVERSDKWTWFINQPSKKQYEYMQELRKSGLTWAEIADTYQTTELAARNRFHYLKNKFDPESISRRPKYQRKTTPPRTTVTVGPYKLNTPWTGTEVNAYHMSSELVVRVLLDAAERVEGTEGRYHLVIVVRPAGD